MEVKTYAQETNSIEFPKESITKILNFVNKANAALAEGDLELVSRSLGEIETEIRDQSSEINVPLNGTFIIVIYLIIFLESNNIQQLLSIYYNYSKADLLLMNNISP